MVGREPTDNKETWIGQKTRWSRVSVKWQEAEHPNNTVQASKLRKSVAAICHKWNATETTLRIELPNLKFPKGLVSLNGKSGQFCRRWYRKILKKWGMCTHWSLHTSIKYCDRAVKISGHKSARGYMFLSGTMLLRFKMLSLSLFNVKKVQNKINTHFTITQHSTDDFYLNILSSPAHRSWNTIMPRAMPLSFSLAPNSPGNFSILSD